jgi:hypothetical protein
MPQIPHTVSYRLKNEIPFPLVRPRREHAPLEIIHPFSSAQKTYPIGSLLGHSHLAIR